MARTVRVAPGGMVDHVLNRGVGKNQIFFNDQVNRYVERNALRANQVDPAEDWPYGSLWIRQHGTIEHRALLSSWPVPKLRKWRDYVNERASEAELAALRRSVARGGRLTEALDGSKRLPNNWDWHQPFASPADPRADKLAPSPFVSPFVSPWMQAT